MFLVPTLLRGNAYLYAFPPGTVGTSQKLCAQCFGHDTASHLQFEKADFHLDSLKCPACESRIFVPNDIKMECVTKPRPPRGF